MAFGEHAAIGAAMRNYTGERRCAGREIGPETASKDCAEDSLADHSQDRHESLRFQIPGI